MRTPGRKREKEKIDWNVADVWKRGYGNRWQVDWLFLALVRAAGFEAYGCWVASRAEYFFTPKTLQSGHLNEPAVLVGGWKNSTPLSGPLVDAFKVMWPAAMIWPTDLVNCALMYT